MPQAATRGSATQCGNMFCNEPVTRKMFLFDDVIMDGNPNRLPIARPGRRVIKIWSNLSLLLWRSMQDRLITDRTIRRLDWIENKSKTNTDWNDQCDYNYPDKYVTADIIYPWTKMDDEFNDDLKRIFVNENICIFTNFIWNIITWGPINDMALLSLIMTRNDIGETALCYLNQAQFSGNFMHQKAN